MGEDTGYGSIVYHYDGSSWTRMTIPSNTAGLSGVWGASGTNVFAVGTNGTILNYVSR